MFNGLVAGIVNWMMQVCIYVKKRTKVFFSNYNVDLVGYC